MTTEISPKVGAAAVGGAVSTIALAVLQARGIDLGAQYGSGIAALGAALFGWLARDGVRDAGAGTEPDPGPVVKPLPVEESNAETPADATPAA